MRAAPRLALLCLALPRAILATDTADIDFLNLQGDIRIAKKERQNLERKVDAEQRPRAPARGRARRQASH